MLSFHSTDSLIDDDNYQFYSDNMDISDPPLLGFDQNLGMTLSGNNTISGLLTIKEISAPIEFEYSKLNEHQYLSLIHI